MSQNRPPYPNSQNALIILSDGAANSKYYTTPKQIGNGSSSGTNQMASKDVNNVAITGTGTYPSYNQQCNQAVTAAQAATQCRYEGIHGCLRGVD